MSEIVQINGNKPAIKLANSFSELADIAIERLEESGKSVVVCGPITTGGLLSITKNLEVINITNRYLERRGYRVFDQVSFEITLQILKDEWKKKNGHNNGQYCMPILEEFYLPIYVSGLIYRGYFLPGWIYSTGAAWERNLFYELGIEVIDFSAVLFSNFLDRLSLNLERKENNV